MRNFISEDNIEQAILSKLKAEPFKYDILVCDADPSKRDDLNDGTGRTSKKECVLPYVMLSSLKRINPTIEEDKIKENDIIVLDANALKFDFNSATIKEEYTPVLEKLKNYIESKNHKISITGYTDSKGTKEYNRELSLRRAESVEEKLIELGLAPEKIIETKGNGDANPIASNDTEEGRSVNRRIEIKFM